MLEAHFIIGYTINLTYMIYSDPVAARITSLFCGASFPSFSAMWLFSTFPLPLLLVVALATCSAAQCTGSSLPNVVNGWNTSVGTALEKQHAEEFFNLSVSSNKDFWRNNDMTRFIGRRLKIVEFTVIERNQVNTLIEAICRVTPPIWTIETGCDGSILGNFVETIVGAKTGVARVAGFASKSVFIMGDSKYLGGRDVMDDWGVNTILETTQDSVTMDYKSFRKGHVRMRWLDQSFGEVVV